MSASDLPGYHDADTTAQIACNADALYVPAHEVWKALDEAHKRALENGLSVADALTRMEVTTLAALSSQYERIEGYGCDYEGPADAIVDGRTGIGTAVCPRCENEVEVNLGSDWRQ